ncbi:diguanylate cyclase [Pontibacillus salicampi]|uniref:Diguanylate cyclase n=1 Tax=Pontibacillus salicampi TaxID=1449801 RepID=A0ABV6LT94_9BACI
MKKYQEKFLTRVKATLETWELQSSVEHTEIYHFLHSLKGTALSIGLEGLTTQAAKLLDKINESDIRIWTYEEWKPFIAPVQEEVDQYHIHNLPETELEPISMLKDTDVSGPLVLVVEDDIEMLTFLKDHLEPYYSVLVAASVEKAVSIFYGQKPDYVIVDIYLGEETGFEILEEIVDKARKSLIPTMLISADSSLQIKTKAYRSGAFDFLAKPFHPEELLSILENRLRYRNTVNQQILTDKLTGAYNRKFLEDELLRQWNEYKRDDYPFSVAMLDIDRFKSVNDTYGHDVGDIILQRLSDMIHSNKRSGDFFIRYGGEEFTVLMPKTTTEQAIVLLNRLRESFARMELSFGESPLSCTFSSGVSTVSSHTGNPNELIKQADIALYQAKRHGRNQVRKFISGEAKMEPAEENVLHIGIVDDDPVIRELLEDQLAGMSIPNHRVAFSYFPDGRSFLDANWTSQQGKFMLLLDGVMPDMDGLHVLEQLRDEANDVVIIMLTARKKDQDIVKALELGADDYITKPFSVKEVEARVKRLANRLLV